MLEKTFYNNTILEWTIAFAIIFGSIILGNLLYWIIKKFVKKATTKTKTSLDDIIIDMVEEPLIFGIIILGVWVSLKSLVLPENFNLWISRGYYILITFNIAWLITRLIDSIIEEYLVPYAEKSEGDLDDVLLPIIRKAIRITIWSVAIIVGLNNAGYDVGALLAGLGIGGLAFALAAQDTVSNIFGGLTIFVDKPFKITDRVKINGFDGIISDIGIRSTRLTTLEGRVVTIPNSKFAHNEIENVSSEPTRKVNFTLGLTYDTDHSRVDFAIKQLKEIILKSSLVENNNYIFFESFGDFSLNIRVIYFIKKSSDIFETQTAINLQILKEFNKNNLDFAFPTQTILNTKVK